MRRPPVLARSTPRRLETLSIIVPAYDEAGTIGDVLAALVELDLAGGLQREILVVDDGSRDRTVDVVRRFRRERPRVPVVLIEQGRNRGKGAAIQRGIAAARGEWLIVQDADLELDPREINRLLEPVLNGTADVVYGNRFANGRPHAAYPRRNYCANRLLTWCSNRLTGQRLGDMEVGYKLMPVPVAKSLVLREQRFGFEPEVTQQLARIPELRWAEVAVSYAPRTAAQGKKITWRDGVRALSCMVRTRLRA